MRLGLVAFWSGVTLLASSVAGFAQDRGVLGRVQLDNITPFARYEPSQYQLRVTLESFTASKSALVRDALMMEGEEAQQMAGQDTSVESEQRCTPARRALLAAAGRSAADSWETDALSASMWDAGPSQVRAATTATDSTYGLRMTGTDQNVAPVSRSEPTTAASQNAATTRSVTSSQQTSTNIVPRSQPVATPNVSTARPVTTSRPTSTGVVSRSQPSVPPSTGQQFWRPSATTQSEPAPRSPATVISRGRSIPNGLELAARIILDTNSALSAVRSPVPSFSR